MCATWKHNGIITALQELGRQTISVSGCLPMCQSVFLMSPADEFPISILAGFILFLVQLGPCVIFSCGM